MGVTVESLEGTEVFQQYWCRRRSRCRGRRAARSKAGVIPHVARNEDIGVAIVVEISDDDRLAVTADRQSREGWILGIGPVPVVDEQERMGARGAGTAVRVGDDIRQAIAVDVRRAGCLQVIRKRIDRRQPARGQAGARRQSHDRITEEGHAGADAVGDDTVRRQRCRRA